MYIEPSHEAGISHVQRQSMAKGARSWCICVVAHICEPMLLVFATRTTWASIRPSVRPSSRPSFETQYQQNRKAWSTTGLQTVHEYGLRHVQIYIQEAKKISYVHEVILFPSSHWQDPEALHRWRCQRQLGSGNLLLVLAVVVLLGGSSRGSGGPGRDRDGRRLLVFAVVVFLGDSRRWSRRG